MTYDGYPDIASKQPPSRRIRLRLIDEIGKR
jgi:hypothetical protein